MENDFINRKGTKMTPHHENISHDCRWVFRTMIGMLPVLFLAGGQTQAAQTLGKYFAHKTVEDQYGVIAPWYQGLNGQCDFRVRVAAETMKRYPWTDPDKDGVCLPTYLVNGRWNISPDGIIKVIPIEEGFTDEMPPGYDKSIQSKHWVNGDYGQKAYFVLLSLAEYYRYTGDPAAIAHMTMQVNHLLDYTLTPSDHSWPNFPISVPIKGQGYHYYDPDSIIQLDLCAAEGMAVLKAYQITGEKRWFEMAKHWGDVFAAKRNLNPGAGEAPWARYANAEGSIPWNTRLTGGVTIIQRFLDELIRLGYTGTNNEIVDARNACKQYLRDALLPSWAANETWGRHYWDWEHPVQGVVPTIDAAICLMSDPDYFNNWRTDVRNILSIFLNHTGVDVNAGGDVFSGAWSYPESSVCCGRSFDYSPMVMSSEAFAQYGVLADSEWAKELARRQIILNSYHFHENGVVEDNIDGGFIVAAEWFKIVVPQPLKHMLDAIAWMPEIFGANRENHIVHSSAVVRSVIYGKGKISYSTFDAPQNTVDVLRLAFVPTSIKADGKKLKKQERLDANGYTVKKLSNGDSIVSIRHDGKTAIVVTGKDPQKIADDKDLKYSGQWTISADKNCLGGKVHTSNSNGAAAVFNFIGNQVRLVGQAGPAGGIADVYMDGEKQLVPIDCWNESPKYQQVLYYKNGLTADKHELKIVVRGSKNCNSVGTDLYLDGVQYSDATGTLGFGSGGGPKTTQRMILGYTGNKPYLDSAGNEWLPGTEFVVRSGWATDSVEKSWWTAPVKEPIANTNDPQLYSYGIHGKEFWVNVTVGPGQYYATLKFASTSRTSPETHNIVTVLINGKEVLTEMDVAEAAGGPLKAVDKIFKNISPQNGIIELRFKGCKDTEAIVQAVEIGPMRI